MLQPFESALRKLHDREMRADRSGWMSRVNESGQALVESYRKLTICGRDPIDYSDRAVQAAYLYAYAMPRAYFAHAMLKRHREAINAPLFKCDHLEIVSFGGGPASEVVGLLQYLNDSRFGESVNSLTLRIFDKNIYWEDVASDVCSAIPGKIDLKLIYQQLDLSNSVSCSNIDISSTNSVFFSYIMSELCALDHRDEIAKNIQTLLGKISAPFSMLFIDSKQTEFIKYFRKCKGFIGKEKSDIGLDIDFNLPKLLHTFENYYKNLGREPRMSVSILSKWYVK